MLDRQEVTGSNPVQPTSAPLQPPPTRGEVFFISSVGLVRQLADDRQEVTGSNLVNEVNDLTSPRTCGRIIQYNPQGVSPHPKSFPQPGEELFVSYSFDVAFFKGLVDFCAIYLVHSPDKLTSLCRFA